MRPGTGSSRSAMSSDCSPGATAFSPRRIDSVIPGWSAGPDLRCTTGNLEIPGSLAAFAPPESRSKLGRRSLFSHGWYATTAIHLGGTWDHACGGRDYRAFGAGRLCRGCFHHRPAEHVYQHG